MYVHSVACALEKVKARGASKETALSHQLLSLKTLSARILFFLLLAYYNDDDTDRFYVLRPRGGRCTFEAIRLYMCVYICYGSCYYIDNAVKAEALNSPQT